MCPRSGICRSLGTEAGSGPMRARIEGSTLRPPAARCSTTNTAAGSSGGSRSTSWSSACTPPADAPMTTVGRVSHPSRVLPRRGHRPSARPRGGAAPRQRPRAPLRRDRGSRPRARAPRRPRARAPGEPPRAASRRSRPRIATSSATGSSSTGRRYRYGRAGVWGSRGGWGADKLSAPHRPASAEPLPPNGSSRKTVAITSGFW